MRVSMEEVVARAKNQFTRVIRETESIRAANERTDEIGKGAEMTHVSANKLKNLTGQFQVSNA